MNKLNERLTLIANLSAAHRAPRIEHQDIDLRGPK